MRTSRVSFKASVLGCLVALLALPAFAQEEVSAQHFQPAIGPGNFLAVDGARVSDETPFSLGVMLNYSRSPFRLTCEPPLCSEQENLDVVRHMYTTDILGSMVVLPRLQLGLRLPVSHVLGEGIGGNELVAAAFGDPTVEAKLRAVGDVDSPVVLGLAAHGSAPLGHAMAEGSFIGNSSFTGGLRAIADLRFGRWAFGANVGGVFREAATLGGEELGSALRYGGAIAYQLGRRVRVVGESVVHQYLGDAASNVIEADAALQFRPSVQPVTITLGGGAGFSEDFGSPVARAILGVRFDTEIIARTFGRAPTEPEPAVRTVSTRPAETPKAEPEPAPQQAAPAPAKTEPVVEKTQEATAEATRAPAPALAPAPTPAPTPAVARSTPAPTPVAARRSNDDLQLIVSTRVYFEFNSFELRPDAFPKLDELARAILDNPDLGVVEVAGHADSVGTDEANAYVSQRRAEVVANYLVGKGVPRNRLVTRGYGANRPEADNETPSGRAKNRRIQLRTMGR